MTNLIKLLSVLTLYYLLKYSQFHILKILENNKENQKLWNMH